MPLKWPINFAALLLVASCAVTDNPVEPGGDPMPRGAGPLVTYTEDREACANQSATKHALFGDLHIHTTFSYDARPFGTRITPADAYRFAKGDAVGAPPYDDSGEPTQTVQLKRPLDFAAVTDHSEFFGEMKLCTDPQSAVYDFKVCKLMREGGAAGMGPFIPPLLTRQPARNAEICGQDGADCKPAAVSPWQATQDMAEEAYDRSAACTFTTFVAYEHTGTPNANNYHRNVIFRNAEVPDHAISYIETPTDRLLWEQLQEQCLDGLPGCDVLAIPHNSNLSSGSMFPSLITGAESVENARAMANLRNAMEPVMEIFQHKGNSECFNGFPGIIGAPDELCEIEQFLIVGERPDMTGNIQSVDFCEDGEIGRRGFVGMGCVSKNDFYRSVLLTGLQDEAVLGINSYKLGAIGSTDTHIGLSGATDEHSWPGHLVAEAKLSDRLSKMNTSPRQITANPGGLAGVWAVENSRDAIFEALRNREVFGTTGTRIKPRLFAGWNLDTQACDMPDRIAYAYSTATPMGGDLTDPPPRGKLRLLASAQQDPDAAALQRLQIIKGWIDEDGQSHYEVIDVAGQENIDGHLDLATGAWSGSGVSSLCAVFEDGTFDPAQSAYYYLRAVQVPTLRWSWAQCMSLPEDQRPAECDNDASKSTQEMAWTSPIWYLPPN